MTRSILWTNAPPLPFSIACGALPQPRSRMALAAATLAAGVASFERITPTSTLSAVRVWLRASERISVTALGIFKFRFSWSPGYIRSFGDGLSGMITALTIIPPTTR
jgi:hypothetical protein